MAEQGNIDQCSLKFHRLNLPQSETAQNEPSIVLCGIPVDYEFNDLIANIAKQLTIDDVKEIKTRLRGRMYTFDMFSDIMHIADQIILDLLGLACIIPLILIIWL